MLDLESLFNLSYGMCIISSKLDNNFNGCIINTAFQITPVPPMLTVSLNRQSLTHEYITKSKVFAISILAEQTPIEFIRKFGFKGGKTPRSKATYIAKKPKPKLEKKGHEMEKYKCLMCGYIYDPAIGDTDNGVAAGTSFDDLPDDWLCPDCGAGKDEFERIED